MTLSIRGPLFSAGGIQGWHQAQIKAAIAAVDRAPGEEVRLAEAALIDRLVSHYRVEPIEFDWAGMHRTPIQEVGTTQVITIYIPATGERDLFGFRASTYTASSGVDASLMSDGHVTFTIHGHNMDAEAIKTQIDEVRRRLVEGAKFANEDAAAFNQTLRGAIAQRTSARKATLDVNASLDDALDIPLRRAPADQQIPIPVVRKTLRVATPSSNDSRDPAIPQEIYEDVVRTIRGLGNAMERLHRTASSFDEEAIRDLILFVLNSNYEGQASGETFNGAGKTDILLPWRDGNAFIGECKVWDGPAKFSEAIDQLLGYLVWRDTKAALVLFIKRAGPSAIIDKADETLRGHPCFVSAATPTEPDLRRDFILRATDDADRHIQVALLPVVIRNDEPSEEP